MGRSYYRKHNITMNKEIYLFKCQFLAYLRIKPDDRAFGDIMLNLHLGEAVLSKNWKTFNFSWTTEKLMKSDFPFIDATIPVISQQAYNILHPLTKENAQYLPINVAGNRFYIVNVLKVYQKIVDLKDTRDNHYTFYPMENLASIFKIREQFTPFFVTSQIKDAIETANLIGYKFIKCKIKERSFLGKLFNAK